MKILRFVILLLTFHLISCNDYNPFENMDNVDVKIRKSASSVSIRDTFEIFSTESLTVYPTIFEEIDSFSILTNGNRLDSAQSVTIVKPPAGDHRFYFSWNNSGPTSVTITVYRSDGKSFSRGYDCHCICPLLQDSIICEAGSNCTLYTRSLHDQHLKYHWYFGEFSGKQIGYDSYKAGIPLPFDELRVGSTRGKGSLWVTDSNDYCSPKVPFNYYITDNNPPLLAAVSGHLSEIGDTVITGDSLFLFRVRVMDKGGIRNVTFNGGDYDEREIAADGEIFTKIMPDMPRYTQSVPFIITTEATDNSGKNSKKRFVLVYSPDGPKSEAVVIRIVNPGSSSSPTTDTIVNIIYDIYNYSSDTVFAKAIRSGPLSSKPDTVLPRFSKRMISWECPLSIGTNQIDVIAFRNDTIASESVIINRITEMTGTIPPSIPYILINGKDSEHHLVQSTSAICSFLAVKGSHEIRSVTINGNPATPSNGNSNLFTDTIQTLHAGTAVTIKVVDMQGASADTVLFVRKNSLPEYTGALQRRYITGSRQLDTLLFSDNDGDSVSCTVVVDPQIAAEFSFRKIARNMVVIEWRGTGTPQTGLYTATITLWDGYQSVNTQKEFYVTLAGPTGIQPYAISRSFVDTIDTLKDGSIDLSSRTAPVRIDFSIVNSLKELTPQDSIIVENADVVTFSTVPGQFSLTLSGNSRKYFDTVNILVKGTDGVIDTAGRMPVVYPPRTPDFFPALTYWCGLDRGEGTDMTIRDDSALEWWTNRISSTAQFYSYTNGAEALIYKNTTPNQLSSLYFGTRRVVLINNKDGELGQGGSWPNSPFTAFFAAKIKDNIPASKGILWSSSDYDYIYFALGVSEKGNLSILKGTESCSTVVESDIKLDTAWHIIMFRSNGPDNSGNISIQMGTSEIPTSSVTTSSDDISDNLMIGSANKHFGRHAWPGLIAEVIFYQHRLTDNECREVGKYLQNHYKIN
jgi:hypothetical protein